MIQNKVRRYFIVAKHGVTTFVVFKIVAEHGVTTFVIFKAVAKHGVTTFVVFKAVERLKSSLHVSRQNLTSETLAREQNV